MATFLEIGNRWINLDQIAFATFGEKETGIYFNNDVPSAGQRRPDLVLLEDDAKRFCNVLAQLAGADESGLYARIKASGAGKE